MPDEDSNLPPSTGHVDESTLLPVERDRSFVFRLVAAILVGIVAAAFVGAKLKGWAGTCGAGLIKPGSTVIPADGRR